MDKYEKFYKTYKSKTYEVVDAEQPDFILDETAPVNKAAKKNKKKHDSKTEQQKVINSREEALSKLVQKQNYEIAELKGKIADLTTQNAKLTLSLQEQKPDAELNAKYIALQEKYLKNTGKYGGPRESLRRRSWHLNIKSMTKMGKSKRRSVPWTVWIWM